MDILRKCADLFSKYIGKKYKFTLDCKLTVNVIFNKNQFHHLIGLQYLTDIAQVDARKADNSTGYIYKQILKNKITQNTIERSSFYNEIQKRLNYFLHFDDIINSKIIIDFDYTKLNTKIMSKYLLYRQFGNVYAIVGLKYSEKYDAFVPETFMVEPTDYYIKDQISYNIVDVEFETLKKY